MSAKTKTNTLHTLEAQVLARELLRHHEQVCRQLGVRKPKDVHDGMIGRSVMPYGTLCELAGVPFLRTALVATLVKLPSGAIRTVGLP